jgi:protein TonB
MTPGRIWSIVLVAILHALLGYAFVTGLAYKFVKQAAEDLKTFEVQEEAPPPEEPPPEQPKQTPPPPVTAPPPLVRLPPAPSPVNVQPPLPPAPPAPITPPAPPAPAPAPPPPVRVEPARARANLASYVSDADYPAAAQRNEEQGTTGFRLTIGTDGRVTNCEVTSSSGSSSLDSTTCNIMRRRARFTPARDSSGNPTTDTHSARIRWVLPSN